MKKKKLLITSFITLLPLLVGVVLYSKLPNPIATHFDANGDPNGFTSRALTVFGIPCFLLGIHLLCVYAMEKNKQKIQSEKMNEVMYWFVPIISNFVLLSSYAMALGIELNLSKIVPIVSGIIFMILGNYLPKVKQNSVTGIKTSATLRSEKSWYLTHRLAGKIWMVSGVIFILSSFLPKYQGIIFIGLILIMTVVPIVYSYQIKE